LYFNLRLFAALLSFFLFSDVQTTPSRSRPLHSTSNGSRGSRGATTTTGQGGKAKAKPIDFDADPAYDFATIGAWQCALSFFLLFFVFSAFSLFLAVY
jgi:hypothetical protein